MTYPGNGILLSTEKKSAIEPGEDMNYFKYKLPRERNQCEKATYCMITTMWTLVKTKVSRKRKDQLLSGVGGRES